MARALPLVSTPEFGTGLPTGDWQALRGELVALLDQVEGQYAETGSADPAFAGFAQRIRDLRYQVADADPQDRHREALRSVKRQVDRFHDRGEPEATPQADTVLQSAIQPIRARTQAAAPHPMAAPMAAQPVAAAPRFDEFSQAVTGLAARLEQLEAELKVQRGNASQVREIADQVSQLSQVVELLAGAVGESGQVKRLESQIAGLAQLIGEGQKVDLGQLTDRLDQVSATVDRLADLQVQQIQHVVREAEATPQKEVEAARGLQAIEAGVRNIYDRIDTLESSVALPQDELERLGQMLGNITARLGADNARPDRLLGLVDALNGRINELEDRGEALAGLKGDIRGLREAVLGAIEPRFVAIEEKLDTLGAQLDRRDDNPTLTQLEAQIRQLVARMDQTGEQLASLAKLYTREDRGQPDMERLASLVASKTSEAIGSMAPKGEAEAGGISTEGLDAIEKRVARLIETARPRDDLSGMQTGIRKVDERLERLEAAIARINADRSERPAPTPAPAMPAAPLQKPSVRIPGAATIADDMPSNPSDDRPLIDKGPADLAPVRAALDAAAREPRAPRREHASSPAEMVARLAGDKPAAEVQAPRIDPNSIARPPRPVSALGSLAALGALPGLALRPASCACAAARAAARACSISSRVDRLRAGSGAKDRGSAS